MRARDWASYILRRAVPCLVIPLALALMFVAASRVAAAEQEVVSVTALPFDGGTYRVSVIFPGVIRDSSGKTALTDLWQRSGWKPSAVQWVQTPALKRFPAATSVEFTVDTLYPGGNFPVETIALAFKRWGGVDVTVAHDGKFRFNGQPHNENADATMDVTTGPNALNVFVRIKNPNIRSLRFATMAAPPAAGTPARAPSSPKKVPVWIVMLIALPLAGLTGVVVYLFLDGKRNGGK